MTAAELITLANYVLFVGLFVAVLWHAIRQPSRTRLDVLLLFGSIAGVILVSRGADLLGIGDTPWLTGVVLVLLNLAPLAMLRLVDDFSGTPRWVQVVGVLAFVAISILSFFALQAQQLFLEVTIGYFAIVGGYAAIAFVREARRTRGITRRRMTAVATGAVTFIGAIVLVFANALLANPAPEILAQLMAFASGIAFFLGFAPPSWMRRAWREPDLRGFLERSVHLAGIDDERRAVVEIQSAAAAAFGATGAAIGLATPDGEVLRYVNHADEWVDYRADAFIGGRAFSEQRRVVSLDSGVDDPENAAVYRRNSANTVIAAPITSEDRRVGVLTIFAERAPIFIEDDLWLLELLADQTAVILEARALSAEAATIRSREDAARLKEEFLSAAAHDLRTPLTVVLGQAELLERRLVREPSAPIDPAGVTRIVREARRLRDLVSELLDVQRLEQGAAVMDRVETDLRDIVGAVGRRFGDHGLDLRVVQPDDPAVCAVDPTRVEQLLDNLVENALKYTASGRLPELHLRTEAGEARLAVVDHGVGIPEEERERIFERFYRASNVQSLTDTGMGLGLYICRRIAEAHGGRIWVEPTPGGGSTFVVAIPTLDHSPATDHAVGASWPVAGTEAVADA